LDIEDRLRLLEPLPQTGVLFAQLLVLHSHRIATTALRASWLSQRLQRPFSPCPPPFRQVRRIQPLATQQRRDLARLLAPICLFQNTEFVLGTELPALGFFRYFWVGTGRDVSVEVPPLRSGISTDTDTCSLLPLLVLIISNSPLRPVDSLNSEGEVSHPNMARRVVYCRNRLVHPR